MATLRSPVRRLLIAGGFAAALAAAPAVATLATPAAAPAPVLAECGEVVDGVALNDCAEPTPAPDQPGDVTLSTPGDPQSLPEVQGVPCNGRNLGECIGLEEDQGPAFQAPQSEISDSP